MCSVSKSVMYCILLKHPVPKKSTSDEHESLLPLPFSSDLEIEEFVTYVWDIVWKGWVILRARPDASRARNNATFPDDIPDISYSLMLWWDCTLILAIVDRLNGALYIRFNYVDALEVSPLLLTFCRSQRCSAPLI